MARAAKKKIGRPAGRKPVLALRVEQEIIDKLSSAAALAPGGRTIAEETVRRLQRSFREDEVIGGPEIADLAHTVTALFAFVAKREAIAAGHPEWTAKEWLADQECYQSGVVEVCRTLIKGLPNPSREQYDLTLKSIVGLLGIDLHLRGEIESGSGFIKRKDDQQ
jgi:hypothetical protein